jgi:hypothetical protein
VVILDKGFRLALFDRLNAGALGVKDLARRAIAGAALVPALAVQSSW